MNRQPKPQGPALLITGGSGFVGRALIRELLVSRPVLHVSEIRIFDLHEPTGLPDDSRIRYLPGDIRDIAAVRAATEGIDAVIHLAAMVDWGTHPSSTVYEINHQGTMNALLAARLAGVRAFVYTSSLDAVISGKPLRDVDESIPYPRTPANAYCGSKAEAEKAVLAADESTGSGGPMRTVCLRPSSVWGEGDPYHISALIELARTGPYVRIGDGKAEQQLVYVGNLAHAHLLAVRELLDGAVEKREPRCGGKTYFITDGPPENFFIFFDAIVEASGNPIRPKSLWIPRWLMMALAVLVEAAAWLVRSFKEWNPKISRFAVGYTCNDFTYSSRRAEVDFGFHPRYGRTEALEATAGWFETHGPVHPPVVPSSF